MATAASVKFPSLRNACILTDKYRVNALYLSR